MTSSTDKAKFVHGTGQDTGKHKMEYAKVRYAGNREGATGFLRAALDPLGINSEHLQVNGVRRYNDPPTGKSWGGAGSHIVIGDGADVKVGFRSFVKAGDYSVVMTDNECYVVVGSNSSMQVDHYSTAFGGDNCNCRCGFQGVLSIDNNGWAIGYDKSEIYTGDNCTIKLRHYGTVIAGSNCTVETGNYCEIKSGSGCHISAGRNCVIQAGVGTTVKGDSGTVIRLTGTDGTEVLREVRHLELKRNVTYRLGINNEFVEV